MDTKELHHEMEVKGKLVHFIFNPNWEVVTEEDTNGITCLIRGTQFLKMSTDSAWTYYYYASDEMGSTTHIVDEDGGVWNRYEGQPDYQRGLSPTSIPTMNSS